MNCEGEDGDSYLTLKRKHEKVLKKYENVSKDYFAIMNKNNKTTQKYKKKCLQVQELELKLSEYRKRLGYE